MIVCGPFGGDRSTCVPQAKEQDFASGISFLVFVFWLGYLAQSTARIYTGGSDKGFPGPKLPDYPTGPYHVI